MNQSDMKIALDEQGNPAPGARKFIYRAHSDTLVPIYQDSHLTHLQANPMVADDQGRFGAFHLSAGRYRIVIVSKRGSLLNEWSDFSIRERAQPKIAASFVSVEDLLTDSGLAYDQTASQRIHQNDLIQVVEGGFLYEVLDAEADDYHVESANGVKLRVLIGEKGFNVKAFGAKGNGVDDDTQAIQAAIDTRHTIVFPAGVFRAQGLVLNNNGQRLIGSGYSFLMKNADGPVLTGSGRNVGVERLVVQGGSESPPEFTGHNIDFSGHGFEFLQSASHNCQGRAIRSTGDHTLISNPCSEIATAATGADAYDIELGQAGVVSLYHRVTNWYSGSFDGGILLVDTGSHFLSNSQFGKLSIQSTGTLPGSNGGITQGCRIGGDITVSGSNAVFTGNQPSSSACNVTFEAGTSGCRWDVSNTHPASITNNGNSNNLILQDTSLGGVAQLSFGDDSWQSDIKITSYGEWEFPGHVVIPDGKNLRYRMADGSSNAITGFGGGNSYFGLNSGFSMLSSGSGGVYLATEGSSRVQVANDGMRPVADAAYALGGPANRYATIYAASGAINTSDAREKREIRPLNDAELRVAKKCKNLICAFQWRDADRLGDQIQVGVIAQDVVAAFQSEGLDAHAYGLITHDSWEGAPEQSDLDGNVVASATSAGERYGVRYDQLLAFVISGIG